MTPKGHWPKGKLRGTDQRWPALLAALQRLRGVGVSAAALARALRVDSRTLRRWLTGEQHPGDSRIHLIDSAVERLIEEHWPDEALPSPVIDQPRGDYAARSDRRRSGIKRHAEG